jgi:regulatory protein
MRQARTRKPNSDSRQVSEEAAREKCLRLLSRRARSEAELRARLRQAGFAERLTEEVLAGLAEAGLTDDEEFARAWVASRKGRGGSGRQKLSWELRRKGVARDVIERVLEEEIDEATERRQAEELARRRLGNRTDAKEMSRLRRYLLGRGYGFETVDGVLQKMRQEDEHSFD